MKSTPTCNNPLHVYLLSSLVSSLVISLDSACPANIDINIFVLDAKKIHP